MHLAVTLWLISSFPLGVLTGRVIRNGQPRENAAEERGEGLGIDHYDFRLTSQVQ